MSPQQHELYSEDTGAYVLGALEEAEETRFVGHLRTCHVCRDEVDRLTQAVDALPRSVTPVAPPSSLRTAVMGAIDAEVREQEPHSESAGQRLRSRLAAIGSVFAGVRPRAASLTIVAVLAVGLAAGFGVAQLTDAGGSSSRTVTAQFDGKRVANGSGNLVISDSSDAGGTLRVHGMPALRSNEVYQVWLTRRGEVIPKALFSVSEDGSGLTAVDGDLKDADSVMVTREPAGGARSPSGKPILIVKL
ncbi:MAG: anti-sigma factor [Thermoleophilaceae bacterium]